MWVCYSLPVIDNGLEKIVDQKICVNVMLNGEKPSRILCMHKSAWFPDTDDGSQTERMVSIIWFSGSDDLSSLPSESRGMQSEAESWTYIRIFSPSRGMIFPVIFSHIDFRYYIRIQLTMMAPEVARMTHLKRQSGRSVSTNTSTTPHTSSK